MDIVSLDLLARWSHGLFGITWIGMLYYFNFVQGGYFKQASPEALRDAKALLAPNALWWFRWGAMFTFLTGIVLFGLIGSRVNGFIVLGATLATLMFLNVWLVIWPQQKVALGLVTEGDPAAAAGKALLASRTNTLFSAPMLYGMFASMHSVGPGAVPLSAGAASTTGLIVALLIVLALEANALFGKMGPMASVKGVIASSLGLTAVLVLVVQFYALYQAQLAVNRLGGDPFGKANQQFTVHNHLWIAVGFYLWFNLVSNCVYPPPPPSSASGPPVMPVPGAVR